MSNVKGPDTAPNRNQKFEQLVDQYQKSVLQMCYLYLCDKSLAEDAVQDTFLKVYQRLDTFRGESSEKTWIMRIAICWILCRKSFLLMASQTSNLCCIGLQPWGPCAMSNKGKPITKNTLSHVPLQTQQDPGSMMRLKDIRLPQHRSLRECPFFCQEPFSQSILITHVPGCIILARITTVLEKNHQSGRNIVPG